MRTTLTRLMMGLAITTLAVLGADNTIGTWKLNMALKAPRLNSPFRHL